MINRSACGTKRSTVLADCAPADSSIATVDALPPRKLRRCISAPLNYSETPLGQRQPCQAAQRRRAEHLGNQLGQVLRHEHTPRLHHRMISRSLSLLTAAVSLMRE